MIRRLCFTFPLFVYRCYLGTLFYKNHLCNLLYIAYNLISFDIPLLSINLCLPRQAVYKEKPAAAGFEPRTFQLSGNYADHQGPFTGKTIIEIKFWLKQLFVKKNFKAAKVLRCQNFFKQRHFWEKKSKLKIERLTNDDLLSISGEEKKLSLSS